MCINTNTENMKCNKCNVDDVHPPFEVCVKCIQKALEKSDIIINDLLAYANSYRGSCSRTKLFNACLHEFKDTKIYEAKELLYARYQEILGIPAVRIGAKKKKRIIVLMTV